MIKIQNPTPATQAFLDYISDATYDAIELGGSRAKQALRETASQVERRQIAELAPSVDPAEVELTDEQWAKLTKQVRILAASSAEEW